MYIAVTIKGHLVASVSHGDALRAYRNSKEAVKGVYSIVNNKAEHCNISASSFHPPEGQTGATELMLLDKQADIALMEYLDDRHLLRAHFTLKEIAERAEILKRAWTVDEILEGNSLDMHMQAMKDAEIQLIAEGQVS